ncbi:MAG: dioxygenase [Planctomycetes bacterium]|nr:dioxygenase [Planctomycetota bacterium]MCA8936110.1 dioxygenase [Planctomycetota bacterium]
MTRMPVLFVPHGGGPWPFVDLPMFDKAGQAELAAFLRGLPDSLPARPKALLVISAHWEAPVPTLMTGSHPPMLYDYYGFPPESYEIQWPAPGDPALAARVRDLLQGAGFDTAEDAQRGFDHGTFVPLKLAFPDADVPTVQLSLMSDLDSARHIKLGQALAPLRDEGVLIIGSGMTYHDLRGFFRDPREVSETFDKWLQQAVTAEPEERNEQLKEWAKAPAARQAHPREEHLIPLLVTAGAAEQDPAKVPYTGTFGNARITAFQFG